MLALRGIAGKACAHSLSTMPSPTSLLRLSVSGLTVLLAQSHLHAAPVKPAAESAVITSKTADRLTTLTAEIKDAKELYLVASSGEDTSCDWADWVEPQLIMADGSRVELSTLKWASAQASHGQAGRAKNM